MKRDAGIIRELLFEIEENDGFAIGKRRQANAQRNFTDARLYHTLLMLDEGLLAEVGDASSYVRMTAAGHDFLDAVRDETVWAKTKAKLKEAGGDITTGTVKAVAISFLKDKLGAISDLITP
ncbi:DUF2513 domain-containing protein [Rhodovulum sp. DZ06]|uniref:DUF2513 domain-containing protein n=1 Tax=Rhodovulum sp. DZ06 TaxID=3425126 RepID=UPI003D34A6B1